MKKSFILLMISILLLGGLVGCNSASNNNDAGNQNQMEKLVVGATAKPHAEILQVVKPILAESGVDLDIREFTDYVLLNPAVQDGQIDANFFQHIPYLDDYNKENNTDLQPLVKVHNEPMGVYSQKFNSIDEIADGSGIGIPNDTTNSGRALLVLQSAGLITLKDGASYKATTDDIVENDKNLKITMMDAAMLPRALEDLDLCVINSNYALEANLNPAEDSLYMEAKDSPYANVLVVKAENINKQSVQILANALQSQEVKDFLENTYPDSCIPSF